MAIVSNNFNVDSNGNMTCNNGQFNGGEIKLYGGTENNARFTIKNEDEVGRTEIIPTMVGIDGEGKNASLYVRYSHSDNNAINLVSSNEGGLFQVGDGYDSNFFNVDGWNRYVSTLGPITATAFNNSSKENIKKNISKFDINVLEKIKNSEIYEFNYKTENDTDKKHIGFIIGDKYKTPTEVISNNKESIDTYSMASILWKAIQEQQEMIEDLQNEIK